MLNKCGDPPCSHVETHLAHTSLWRLTPHTNTHHVVTHLVHTPTWVPSALPASRCPRPGRSPWRPGWCPHPSPGGTAPHAGDRGNTHCGALWGDNRCSGEWLNHVETVWHGCWPFVSLLKYINLFKVIIMFCLDKIVMSWTILFVSNYM